MSHVTYLSTQESKVMVTTLAFAVLLQVTLCALSLSWIIQIYAFFESRFLVFKFPSVNKLDSKAF